MRDPDVFDRELVAAFLRRVEGVPGAKIVEQVRGIKKNDISRWRHGQFKRLSAEKRAALIRFLSQPQQAEGAPAVRRAILPPLLKMQRALSELIEAMADYFDRSVPADPEAIRKGLAVLADEEDDGNSRARP